MNYRLCIFDFDGTLADSFDWFVSAVNQVADEYDFKRIEAHERDALRGLSAKEIVAHLDVPLLNLPAIGTRLRELQAQNIGKIGLFPGIDDMLRRLTDAGAVTAISSSNSEANVRAVLGPQNALRINYYECGSSLFGKHRRIKTLLERARIPAAETIFIGDEVRDADAARKARVAFGAVTWGYTKLEALMAESPAAVFRRAEDIGR